MVSRIRSIPFVFRHVHFGNECLSRRIELKLTNEEICVLTGLSSATVSVYERGKEPNMHIRHFLALCNVYDLNPSEFFELEVH